VAQVPLCSCFEILYGNSGLRKVSKGVKNNNLKAKDKLAKKKTLLSYIFFVRAIAAHLVQRVL